MIDTQEINKKLDIYYVFAFRRAEYTWEDWRMSVRRGTPLVPVPRTTHHAPLPSARPPPDMTRRDVGCISTHRVHLGLVRSWDNYYNLWRIGEEREAQGTEAITQRHPTMPVYQGPRRAFCQITECPGWMAGGACTGTRAPLSRRRVWRPSSAIPQQEHVTFTFRILNLIFSLKPVPLLTE